MIITGDFIRKQKNNPETGATGENSGGKDLRLPEKEKKNLLKFLT